MENQLSQKIIALVVERMERYYSGLTDDTDAVDRLVKENMEKASAPVRDFVHKRISMFRALPVSRQKEMMGKYYNRHIEIKPVEREKYRMSAIPSTYKIYKRPLFTALEPTIAERWIDWINWLKKEEEDRFYKHVSLELDKIEVIDEDDWGRAEIVVLGGASDGTGDLTHGFVTQEKSAGERETRYFHGSDRVAVPKWPLAENETSKITCCCEV